MSSSNRVISVLMPVGDDILYFSEALNSILNQTYQDFEVVIIDGSDNPQSVVELLPKDERIKHYCREKRGIADALNFGVERCKGEYIARMDSDDISLPSRFDKQVRFLEENRDIDLVGTWFSIIKEDGTLISEERGPYTNASIAANLIFENPICHPSVMIRKKIFDEGVSYPKMTAEDYALWTSMIPKYKLANIPEILFKWRRHENANTNVMIDKVCASDTQSAAEYISSLFNIEISDSSFSEKLLLKKYFKEKLRDCYKIGGADYIFNEFSLLTELRSKCPIWMEHELDVVLHDRWKYILELIGDYSQGIKELMDISFDKNDEYERRNLEFFKKSIEENESSRIEFLMQPYEVVFYGMGKEGIEAFKKYRDAFGKGKTNWKIAALIDSNKHKITVDAIDYVISPAEALNTIKPDFIVITTSVYYKEVEENLINMGFDQRIIKSPAALYYT